MVQRPIFFPENAYILSGNCLLFIHLELEINENKYTREKSK